MKQRDGIDLCRQFAGQVAEAGIEFALLEPLLDLARGKRGNRDLEQRLPGGDLRRKRADARHGGRDRPQAYRAPQRPRQAIDDGA